MTRVQQLEHWMTAEEDEHLEFKQARTGLRSGDLHKYCAALANEGGGKLILGVTDPRPRAVVGTQALHPVAGATLKLVEQFRLRIEVEEILHPCGRTVVVHVPPRPVGLPIAYRGAYWMRAGESVVPMTPDHLRRIFSEGSPDFSAEIVPQAELSDLDLEAVENFRGKWIRKSGRHDLRGLSAAQLLEDAELVVQGQLTNAALILFGRTAALGVHLAQAEVIFEYRASDVSGAAQERIEYRQGFYAFYERLWERVKARNDVQHFQDGLFVYDIPTLNERVVREALLNAVSHRDYRLGGSVFVRQYPRRLEVVSPGGFPPGVTPENILWRQSPRNRRIAEAFARSGLVERSGQGADLMFEVCIRESKPKPDFVGTDAHQVALTLHGEVKEPRFLRFLEQVGRERLASFSTEDLLVADAVYRGDSIPEPVKPRMPRLLDLGIIESVGRGKGVRYLLGQRFYGFLGKRGAYTRRRGLDQETSKALLLKHVEQCGDSGCALKELAQVLPARSKRQVQGLLATLRQEGRIHLKGKTRGGRWCPGASGT